MDSLLILPFLEWLQYFSAEFTSLLTLVCCLLFILLSLWQFGLAGLYAYNILAMVATNIQVLKVVEFQLFPEPVALGTVIFATVFLVSDIITEHYGKKAAQKGVWITFTMQIFMTVFMTLTLAHKPLLNDSVHKALEIVFLPSVRLLIASLTAFAVSQLLEIYLYSKMQAATAGKMLWLRLNLSCAFAALIDNIVFSLLAWVVFSPTPVTLQTLIFTYILGTYVARVFVSILSTPIIYFSYKCLPKND